MPFTVWITINCGKFLKRWEYQTTWPASWEICIPVEKQHLEPDGMLQKPKGLCGWKLGCMVNNNNKSDWKEWGVQMARHLLVHSKEGEVCPVDNETLERSFNWGMSCSDLSDSSKELCGWWWEGEKVLEKVNLEAIVGLCCCPGDISTRPGSTSPTAWVQ